MINRILALEARQRGVPGTCLMRILVDRDYALRRGVRIPKRLHAERYVSIWTLGVGALNEPKIYADGYTIAEAVRNLEQLLAEHDRKRR